MNNVNFLGQANFPLSSDTMDFLQTMIKQSTTFAHLGGENYILWGCQEAGMNVSNGFIVINGEILPFVGGQKQNTVYINEVRRDVNAMGYFFPQVYTTRTCEFGVGNPQYNWTDFKRIETNTALAEAIDNLQSQINRLQGVPVGVRVGWVGLISQIPNDYLLCDGRILLAADYPELYRVLGNIYGGEANLSFALPRMKGRVAVAYDPDDDDYKTIGTTGGQKTIALTAEQNGPHVHEYSGMVYYQNDWRAGGSSSGGYTVYHQDRTTAASGTGKAHENRQPYFVEGYIIKAK